MRFLSVVHLILLAAISTTSAAAIEFPWRDSGEKLDPRDAAFALPIIEPVKEGVEWGVPLEGGAIRTLLIAPRFALRDAAELARRIEVRIDVVPFWDANQLGRPDNFPRTIPGTSAEEVRALLREKLDEKLDLIIAANFDFAILSEEDFGLIAQKIEAGAGLILVHHRHTQPQGLNDFLNRLTPVDSDTGITHGVGEKLTGQWSSGLGFVAAATLGEGRVVEVDLQGDRPATHCLVPYLTNPLVVEQEELDAYLSLIARAARWAAGRDVPVRIERIESAAVSGPEEAQIPPGLDEIIAPGTSAGVSLFQPYVVHLSAPADRTYTVRSQVRQPGRGKPPVQNTWNETLLRKGATSYRFYAIAGAGEYWLDVWLLDKDKVVEWYSDVITVDAWPSIADLILTKSVIQPQDSIGVSFTMPARPRPCAVLVRATDAYGRLVGQHHMRVEPETAYVQTGLNFTDLIADNVKIEVFVSDRNLPILPDWDSQFCAYAYRYLPVRVQYNVDRIETVAVSGGSVEFNARANYAGLKLAGVDILSIPAREESIRTVLNTRLHVIPEVADYRPQSVAEGIRTPCLSDPAFISDERARLGTVMQVVKDIPSRAISLGFENVLGIDDSDVCQSDASKGGFPDYLQHAYGDISALNEAWGTNYNAWSEADLLTLPQAREWGHFATWIDFRLYMDSVFLNTHAAARAIARSADPRARVGFSLMASESPFTGYDLPSLTSQLDFLTAPADVYFDEQMRNARANNAFTGIWLPESLTPAVLRWLPWFTAYHGAVSIWWPDITGSALSVPGGVLLDPMGNLAPYAPEYFGEVGALNNGIAKLLLSASRDNSGIAIYSSRPSAWLNVIDPQFGAGSFEAERAFAQTLLRLGYSFDFVSSDQLAKGKLPNCRVLILPMARAMSDGDVAAIRSFVAGGGSLIADVAPATHDHHGTPRATPAFSGEFGVRHKEVPAASDPANVLVECSFGDAKASAELEGLVADKNVEPDTATVGGVTGAAPVWLISRTKQLGLLMNHSATQSRLDATASLFDAALTEAGAHKAVVVKARRDRAFDGERIAFGYGSARIYGLLANPNAETQKVTIEFDRKATVYDIRAELPELRPANVDVDLEPGAAALFSVLPNDVEQCVLTVPSSIVTGTRLPLLIEVKVKKGEPGNHLVHVQVFSFESQGAVLLDHYSTDIVCSKGMGQGYIPFALNDRLGPHKIVARDVLTGVSTEAIVSLVTERRISQ